MAVGVAVSNTAVIINASNLTVGRCAWRSYSCWRGSFPVRRHSTGGLTETAGQRVGAAAARLWQTVGVGWRRSCPASTWRVTTGSSCSGSAWPLAAQHRGSSGDTCGRERELRLSARDLAQESLAGVMCLVCFRNGSLYTVTNTRV